MKKYIVGGLAIVAIVSSFVFVASARAGVSLWDRIIDKLLSDPETSEKIVDRLMSEIDNQDMGGMTFGATAAGTSATNTLQVYNVVGTRSGTTTTGVGFRTTGSGGFSATSTYALFTGTDTDTVSFYFDVVNASATPNGKVSFSLLAANDLNCQTTISTSPDNRPTAEQIKWYDATRQLDGVDGTVSTGGSFEFGQGTSTITFTALPGQNKVFTFTNLGSNCLGLAISGSSTELQVQAIRKGSLTGF